ncbi:hypothetical protein AMTRI_Chr03g54090 [Amborella trichopoda]
MQAQSALDFLGGFSLNINSLHACSLEASKRFDWKNHSSFHFGKSSWPELKGANGVDAATIIERENPTVDTVIVKEGTPVTRDFRCNRVRVWVNTYGIVTRVPTAG